MDAVSSLSPSRVRRLSFDPAGLVAFVVPALVTVYLALQNGGYGVVERSEVGIAVWWIVLVGTAVGAFSVRMPTAARLLVAVLLAFAAWTAVSLAWTESDERTAIEAARVATYLGVFVLAVVSRRHWRAMLYGLVAGMSLVVLLALLSRLQPNLFPAQTAPDYFPGSGLERRLAYPLNYSTGLAVLAAMTVPLLLSAASASSRLALRAGGAALVPAALLTVWLTASSLAIPLAVLALLAFLALTGDRLIGLASALVATAGSALLILGVEQRDALDSGIVTPAALREGDEMLAMLILVTVGVGLVQAGIVLLDRLYERPAWLQGSRRKTWITVGVLAMAAAVALALTPLNDEVSDGWDRFTSPSELEGQRSTRIQQILDVSSNGRYQFWETAVDAGQQDVLKGIGAGSFEFWWSRERDSLGFARDAHSLFLETFAELGLVGTALIVLFCIGVIAIGCARVIRSGILERQLLAGAGAAFIVFVAAAAVDWMWELAVLPVIALVLAAILVCGREQRSSEADAGSDAAPASAPLGRLALCLIAAVALVAIAVPLSSANALTDSQQAVARGDLPEALRHSDDAAAIEPFAASPELQRALILEQRGQTEAAVNAAQAATRNESTNWRTWLVLSRLEAKAGDATAAVAAYRRARALNPRSPLFAQP